jgi:hypothetical protein
VVRWNHRQPLFLWIHRGITCVFVENFTDFIRSDEAADRFQGVFLHTRSTATELSPDAAAGTDFASKGRNEGAGQRPCDKEIPS